MKQNFHKAYKEVLEILKYMPKEDIEKIPKEIILTFELKMDKDYKFEIDVNKTLEEQVLLEETKDILANLARDYWATPEQKQKIVARENQERKIIEEEKRKKYNPNNIFLNKQDIKNDTKFENTNKKSNIIETKTWYQKFIEFLRKILKEK